MISFIFWLLALPFWFCAYAAYFVATFFEGLAKWISGKESP